MVWLTRVGRFSEALVAQIAEALAAAELPERGGTHT